MKIAIATVGEKGLEDKVSYTFGRAETFTVVETSKGKITNVKVLKNPAASYEYGAGPIVTRMLVEEGVQVVVAGEIGPGASSILEHHKVKKMTVKAGTQVFAVIKKILEQK